MTHLISDEAVYRTAPATPGLLKIARILLGWRVVEVVSENELDYSRVM